MIEQGPWLDEQKIGSCVRQKLAAEGVVGEMGLSMAFGIEELCAEEAKRNYYLTRIAIYGGIGLGALLILYLALGD